MGYPSQAKWPFNGSPLATKKVASTNTAQKLPTAYVGSTSSQITGADAAGETQAAKAATITVETNTIRFSFKATPTQAGLGHLATAGTSLWLGSKEMVDNFQFISASLDTHASLQITPEV